MLHSQPQLLQDLELINHIIVCFQAFIYVSLSSRDELYRPSQRKLNFCFVYIHWAWADMALFRQFQTSSQSSSQFKGRMLPSWGLWNNRFIKHVIKKKKKKGTINFLNDLKQIQSCSGIYGSIPAMSYGFDITIRLITLHMPNHEVKAIL